MYRFTPNAELVNYWIIIKYFTIFISYFFYLGHIISDSKCVIFLICMIADVKRCFYSNYLSLPLLKIIIKTPLTKKEGIN